MAFRAALSIPPIAFSASPPAVLNEAPQEETEEPRCENAPSMRLPTLSIPEATCSPTSLTWSLSWMVRPRPSSSMRLAATADLLESIHAHQPLVEDVLIQVLDLAPGHVR